MKIDFEAFLMMWIVNAPTIQIDLGVAVKWTNKTAFVMTHRSDICSVSTYASLRVRIMREQHVVADLHDRTVET